MSSTVAEGLTRIIHEPCNAPNLEAWQTGRWQLVKWGGNLAPHLAEMTKKIGLDPPQRGNFLPTGHTSPLGEQYPLFSPLLIHWRIRKKRLSNQLFKQVLPEESPG